MDKSIDNMEWKFGRIIVGILNESQALSVKVKEEENKSIRTFYDRGKPAFSMRLEKDYQDKSIYRITVDMFSGVEKNDEDRYMRYIETRMKENGFEWKFTVEFPPRRREEDKEGMTREERNSIRTEAIVIKQKR